MKNILFFMLFSLNVTNVVHSRIHVDKLRSFQFPSLKKNRIQNNSFPSYSNKKFFSTDKKNESDIHLGKNNSDIFNKKKEHELTVEYGELTDKRTGFPTNIFTSPENVQKASLILYNIIYDLCEKDLIMEENSISNESAQPLTFWSRIQNVFTTPKQRWKKTIAKMDAIIDFESFVKKIVLSQHNEIFVYQEEVLDSVEWALFYYVLVALKFVEETPALASKNIYTGIETSYKEVRNIYDKLGHLLFVLHELKKDMRATIGINKLDKYSYKNSLDYNIELSKGNWGELVIKKGANINDLELQVILNYLMKNKSKKI